MRKFLLQHLKGKTSIIEVEVEKATVLSAPNYYGWWSLKEGESVYNVLAPPAIKDMYPHPIMWWALYETPEEAMAEGEKNIRADAERTAIKHHTELDVDSMNAKIAAITVHRVKEI